jgi:hypothetical protein
MSVTTKYLTSGVDNDRLVLSLMDTNAFVFTYSIMQGLKGATAARGECYGVKFVGFCVAGRAAHHRRGAEPEGVLAGFYDFPVTVVGQ